MHFAFNGDPFNYRVSELWPLFFVCTGFIERIGCHAWPKEHSTLMFEGDKVVLAREMGYIMSSACQSWYLLSWIIQVLNAYPAQMQFGPVQGRSTAVFLNHVVKAHVVFSLIIVFQA